jgi:hypothetical protein
LSNQREGNSGLTEQEIVVVKKILVGIAEMLNAIMTKHKPKNYAKSLSGPQRRSKKSITRTSILYNVTTHKQSLHAKPHEIRDNLPDNVKNIYPTDLWKILSSLDRTKFLRYEPHTIRRPRGRPASPGFKDSNRGGKPSLYYKTEKLEKVIDILTRPEAKRLINTTLRESGLLYDFKKYERLVLFHLIRDYGTEALRDNLKPFGIEQNINNIANEKKREKRTTAIEAYFQRIKNLGDEGLENEAGREAEAYIIKHGGDEDLFINTIAGFLGYSNLKD